MLKTLLALIVLFACGLQAGSVSVISAENDFFALYPDSAPPGSYAIAQLSNGDVPMLSFTTFTALTGVNIRARLFTESSGDPLSATAYLTTFVGQDSSNDPTTTADEIARASVAVPFGTVDLSAQPVLYDQVTLFSGLSLDPGTYYMTLGSQDFSFLDWQGAAAIYDTPLGSYQGFYIASTCGCGAFIDPAYPPNSYVDPGGFYQLPYLDFTVTADAPEPSGLLLGISGLGVLWMLSRRK